jgi:hypothetical protein
MRNLIRILIVFLFILPISKSLAHEKIANSTCNLFIKNIIDNYDLIKDHYWMGSTDLKYGFLLEETWDSDLSYADDEGNETFGDTKLRRDEDGNIFISNIFASYAFKVNLKPGDKIIEINKKQAKDYSDNEIDEIFSDEEKKVEITYINQQNKKVTEELERFEIHITRKYLNFKINNFNSINNQTFETDFIVNYHIQAELYDGITKDDYDDMDNDNLFKIVKENFYKKDEEDEWYSTCEYTDDELNQMQLISPSWTVGLLNLSFQSDDTSETTTSFKIYDELTDSDFESIDIISTFDGQIKVKNKFDLRNFPFDKQRIVFNFSELEETDVTLTPLWEIYANLNELLKSDNLINGWKLVDYRVIGHNYQEQGFYKDKFLNQLNIILEIERQSSYYVYKIILPIILILLVCWSAIWITPREIESRLTVTIVCLLSLIAYNFVIDKEIPKLEYLTIMDWVIFTSYVFATIPNFLCIISFKLFTTNKKLCMAIENKAKYVGPIGYVVIVLLIISYNVSLEPENTTQALRLLSK